MEDVERAKNSTIIQKPQRNKPFTDPPPILHHSLLQATANTMRFHTTAPLTALLLPFAFTYRTSQDASTIGLTTSPLTLQPYPWYRQQRMSRDTAKRTRSCVTYSSSPAVPIRYWALVAHELGAVATSLLAMYKEKIWVVKIQRKGLRGRDVEF